MGFEVEFTNVSVAAAVPPLLVEGLIPDTLALVQEKVRPVVPLVAVYVVDTLLQRLAVVGLLSVYVGHYQVRITRPLAPAPPNLSVELFVTAPLPPPP
jgi:hypothetical protein